MSNALDRANELSTAITNFASELSITLPVFRVVQAGTPVIAKCSVVIAAIGISPLMNFDQTAMARCAPPQRTTIVGAIARDYEVVDAEGVDIPDLVAEASALMMADGDLLWEAAWSVENYLGPDNVSLDWNITGALAITSVQYTVGVT